MEIFSFDWIGFVITGLGTLFLIGEILVNMRGLFGLLGIGFMVVYFTAYLEPSSFMIMLIIYVIGLLLIIIDGKLVNDGTLATIGLVFMLTAVALAAPNLYAGLYAVIGVLVGGVSSFLFLKIFKQRNMWNKIALTDRLTTDAGYSTMSQEYESLIGKEGMTQSVLRPVGTIRINHKDYSAVSNGQWLDKGIRIKVVQVDGTKILVEKINIKN